MLKRSLLVVALAGALQLQAKVQLPNDPLAKGVGALLGTGIAMCATTELSNRSATIRRANDSIGVSIQDIKRMIGISGLLWASSYFSDRYGRKLYSLARKVPVWSLAALIASSKTVNDAARNVPILNQLCVCDNSTCEGVCKDCKLTHGVNFLALCALLDSISEHIHK